MRNDRLQRPTACAPLTAVAAALCLSLPASPASADPSAREKASAILAEGAKLYERRDFAAALAHFQSAYALFPNPKIYFDFALAYAGMGKPAQALIALERFLAEARDASPAHTREAREQVKRLSKKVAFVTVKGGADGAEAFLDGTLVGKTPLPARLPVDVGRHAVVMRGSTLGSWSRTFTVVAGQSLELHVEPSPPGGQAAPPPSRETSSSSPAAVAEKLVQQGVQLRKQGKHLESYDYFRRAFETSPTPRPTAQLGLVEYQLGRWVDAEAHLEQASRAVDDPFIRQNRETISQALETVRSHISFIEIKGTPDGADVSVNGRTVGKLPLGGLVKAGDGYAEVVVSAPGYSPIRHSLSLQPGLTRQFFVTLERQSSSGTPSQASRLIVSQAIRTTNQDPPAGNGRLRTAGLVTGAAGIAALGYGLFQNLQGTCPQHRCDQR
jgi:tetratricopeptide (TPR) repeat protein